MKRLFSILLALCLMAGFLTAIPTAAKAESVDCYTYEVIDGRATITGVDPTISGDITIPSTLGGYPVSAIGEGAFSSMESMTGITIPESITSIGDYAFHSCSSLETVYYYGDEAQWQAISVGSQNESLTNANIIFNYQAPNYAQVDFWRLILKENIGVDFEMSFSDEIQADENAYIEVNVAGEITEVPLSSALDGLQVNVAAAQMTDEISICVISGDGIRDEIGTYSVKSYADQIFAGEYDIATKKIVSALLSYGAMAQNYFQYRLDTLANENINFIMSSVPVSEEIPVRVSGVVDGITFYGASLCYENQLALRYYFHMENTSDYTFSVNGVKLEVKEKGDLYYVEVPEILPQEIGDYFRICVENAQAETMDITYNPINYVVRMYHKADATENSKNLLQALYTYYLAAKAYIA